MSTSRSPLPNARVALYNLVQDRLLATGGRSLAAFILERRPAADPVPYRRIASELVDITGIDITHEAVRRWHHRALEEVGTSGLHPVHVNAIAVAAA